MSLGKGAVDCALTRGSLGTTNGDEADQEIDLIVLLLLWGRRAYGYFCGGCLNVSHLEPPIYELGSRINLFNK